MPKAYPHVLLVLQHMNKTYKLFQLPCQLKNFVGLNAGTFVTVTLSPTTIAAVIARYEAISPPREFSHTPDCFVPRNDGGGAHL